MTARRRHPAPARPAPEPPVDEPSAGVLALPTTATSPTRRPNRSGQRSPAPRRTAATRRGNQTPSGANEPAEMLEPENSVGVVGVVGEGSASASRSGEDIRRRGWFWHWNSIVTQYAPLLGLKGVGLLNSYTVWTDRREESPHRGYAFPSQQKEADFYGEERSELITINKILVALDLIEIRKEMVLRTDERGRKWRVPHNFYRVKDHGDGFNLSRDAVHAVVLLADRDRAVYRYVRRIFSPRFAPIDPENVWGTILEQLRGTEVWERLAAKTVRDEDRASARSRAGHASRRAASDPTFLLPPDGDTATPEPTPRDSTNDSTTVEITTGDETSVATTNTGLAPDVDESNTGLVAEGPSTVAPTSNGAPTSVAPSNRTYHQENTTTTTGAQRHDWMPKPPVGGPGEAGPPDGTRDEATAILRFEEANARPASPAERRLLRDLARAFDPAAATTSVPASGWAWLGAAIDDAVAAGSAFVAPRRLREILSRWEREGPPPELGGSKAALPREQSRGGGGRGQTRQPVEPRPPSPVSSPADERSRPNRQPSPSGGLGTADVEPATVPSFRVEECGLSNRQVWSAILDELRSSGDRASVDTWLRDAMILGRGTEGALVVGVPHELARRRVADRFVTALRRAVTVVVGVALPVEVVLARDWFADQDGHGGRLEGQTGAKDAKRSG